MSGTPATFEEAVARRWAELDATAADDDDRRIAFLLDTAPFIREYYATAATADDGAARPSPQKRRGETPASVAELSTVVAVSNRGDILSRFMVHEATKEGKEDDPATFRRWRRDAKRGGASPSEWTACECGAPVVSDHAQWDTVCTACGVVARMDLDFGGDNPGSVSHAQRDGLTRINHMAYKRANHFSEWLNVMQGRENKEIPPEVIDAVRCELRKNRVTSRDDITALRVRGILKKAGLSSYYDNMYRIAHMVGGPPPPSFSPTFEAQLKTMFVRCQEPFEKAKPPERKNFLSYGYTIYKFCELLGADHALRDLMLLKSTEKLHVQDEIWRKMCAILKWEFIPSGIMTQTNAFHNKMLTS